LDFEKEKKLRDLIKTLSPEEAASAAASMFEKWCEKAGSDPGSCSTFLETFVDVQYDDDKRNALIAALDAYRAPAWAKP
jgi:hypothetical protein